MKQIFRMRKTIMIIIIGAITCIILSGFFFINNTPSVASATMTLSYNGAEQGKLPNGHLYSIHAIMTDDMIKTIISQLSMEDVLSVEQMRSALFIQSVFPENYNQRYMEERHSELYVPTRYVFKLNSKKLPSVSENTIKEILNSIMMNVADRIRKLGSFGIIDEATFAMLFNDSEREYDYQLTLLQNEMAAIKDYLDEIYPFYSMLDAVEAEKMKTYVIDLASFVNSDADRIIKKIKQNGMNGSEDRDTKIREYENRIQLLTKKLSIQRVIIDQTDKIIAAYPKAAKLMIENEEKGQSKEESQEVTAYEELLKIRANMVKENDDIQDKLTSSKATYAMFSEYTGLDETPENSSIRSDDKIEKTIEEDILEIQRYVREGVSETNRYIGQINDASINSNGMEISEVSVSKPTLLSAAFVKYTIKLLIPICIIVFLFCVIFEMAKQIIGMKLAKHHRR